MQCTHRAEICHDGCNYSGLKASSGRVMHPSTLLTSAHIKFDVVRTHRIGCRAERRVSICMPKIVRCAQDDSQGQQLLSLEKKIIQSPTQGITDKPE